MPGVRLYQEPDFGHSYNHLAHTFHFGAFSSSDETPRHADPGSLTGLGHSLELIGAIRLRLLFQEDFDPTGIPHRNPCSKEALFSVQITQEREKAAARTAQSSAVAKQFTCLLPEPLFSFPADRFEPTIFFLNRYYGREDDYAKRKPRYKESS